MLEKIEKNQGNITSLIDENIETLEKEHEEIRKFGNYNSEMSLEEIIDSLEYWVLIRGDILNSNK